jgi:hypothetical protein
MAYNVVYFDKSPIAEFLKEETCGTSSENDSEGLHFLSDPPPHHSPK